MPDIKELNFWSLRSHFFPREHYTPDQYLCPVCSPTSFTIPLCSCGADAGLDWTCVGAADAMSAGLSEYSVREGRERGKGTGRILRDASTVSRGREERPSTTDHALLNRKHSARMYTSKCCTSSGHRVTLTRWMGRFACDVRKRVMTSGKWGGATRQHRFEKSVCTYTTTHPLKCLRFVIHLN